MHHSLKTTRSLPLCAWLILALTLTSATSALRPTPVVAQSAVNTAPAQGRQLNLRQQLTTGLRAFTPEDKAFINKVVAAVEQGRLPRRLVDNTFLWARQRASNRSYNRRLRPMVFFKPGLTLQAKRAGLNL